MIIAHASGFSETGARIGHARSRHAETRLEVHAERSYNDCTQSQQHQVEHDEQHGHVDDALFLYHAVELDANHGIGVLPANHHRPDRLERQQHAVAFDSAGSRSGASTLHRKQSQHHNSQRRPNRRIGRGKTGRRRHRHDLKKAVAHRRGKSRIHIARPKADRNDQTSEQQRQNIVATDLGTEYIVAFPGQRSENQSEMKPRYGHEKHDDHLDPQTAVRRDTGIPRTESSRGDRRKRIAHGLEPTHSRHPEQYRLDQRQTDIDDQQNLQDFLRPVAEIILGHGRKLDARQAHLGRSHRRQDDQNEHHNAHAAQPMGRGSPEKKPPRQRLHIAQAGRSGRRKARNGLEPGVRNRKLAPPKHIREHAGQTRHQPCPDDDRIALLAGDLSAARNEYQRKSA